MLDWYHTANIDQLRTDNPAFKALYKKDILAGLLIAHDLEEMGLKLKYTPGFFKIADKWCFRYLTGILIPTISFENNIVCFQVRRDATKGGLRYLTVSSKGLPGGPTTGLSRIHIAHDAPIAGNTTVYITEGPLKANVILSLLRQRGCQNTAVIAIQGVSNVKELPEVLEKIKQCGVTKTIMLFDMDSLKGGNINVTQSTGTFSIPRGLLSPSQFCFGVQVSDDSMLGYSLRRGDYAIFCLEAASANGKACLVTLNGTPMIRICEVDEQENVKALIPMNDAYKPIKIKKTDDVKVVGPLAVIISVKS